MDSLRNHYFWFSKFEDLNDPNDGSSKLVNMSLTESGLIALIRRQYSEEMANFMIQLVQQKQLNLTELEEAGKRFFEHVRGFRGIHCLSKLNNDIQMWAYYANQGSGIVLGFDIEAHKESFASIVEVNYVDDFKPFDYFNAESQTDALFEFQRTKSNKWSFEKEVRILRNETGKQNFHPNNLKEVIFGHKTSRTDIESIKQIIGEVGYNVEFKQTVIDVGLSNSYQIVTLEI